MAPQYFADGVPNFFCRRTGWTWSGDRVTARTNDVARRIVTAL